MRARALAIAARAITTSSDTSSRHTGGRVPIVARAIARIASPTTAADGFAT
jgi:hypothetical protein